MNGVITAFRTLRLFIFLLAVGAGCFLLNSKASAQPVLIPTNAVWRYFDIGEDLGISQWKSLNFVEDYRWKSGAAELGFGLLVLFCYFFARGIVGIALGAVAQLGERCVRNAEVEGSTPFRSTLLASVGRTGG